MYSPKIREDLIPVLYRMGKEQGKPMTHIVDDIIRGYLTIQNDFPEIQDESFLEKLCCHECIHNQYKSD